MAWLFTCRHGFEATLRAELARRGLPLSLSSVLLPGLVRAELPQAPAAEALAQWDAAYALQVLPAAKLIFGNTVSELRDAALTALPDQWDAWRGRWHVHALVPGQLKGQPQPAMGPRAKLVERALAGALAKRPQQPTSDEGARVASLLLTDVDRGWFAASPAVPLFSGSYWPSLLPAGLANPADDRTAPNSAFRKLREALAAFAGPAGGDQVVDLGASPGGWTHVARQLGCAVTAVDRAELAPPLMADPQVRFVRGDAFAWQPERPADGLLCDIIAAPDRSCALLANWCKHGWMNWFVVQLKFKGEPAWQTIDDALAAARSHGYAARAKHFFNDKNELTLFGRKISAV